MVPLLLSAALYGSLLSTPTGLWPRKLDMPPDVAGVTFLAFGNGAPDVFSSFVAMTNSKDREASLMVGMGLLLGASESVLIKYYNGSVLNFV